MLPYQIMMNICNEAKKCKQRFAYREQTKNDDHCTYGDIATKISQSYSLQEALSAPSPVQSFAKNSHNVENEIAENTENIL